MGFPQRSSAAAVLVGLLVAVSNVATVANVDGDPEPVIVVRVDNLAGVLPDDLQFAEQRASEIFQQIAVRIRWVDQENAIRGRIRPSFTVVVADAEGGRASASVDALGVTNATIHRAHAFYDRIAALNVGTSRTIPSLLGDVIAHELGHLLLAPPGHSLNGIMRPELERKLWAVRTFTPMQAREIRTRLATASRVEANSGDATAR